MMKRSPAKYTDGEVLRSGPGKGWTVKLYERKSGVSAGSTYAIFLSPDGRTRCRSMVAVQRLLAPDGSPAKRQQISGKKTVTAADEEEALSSAAPLQMGTERHANVPVGSIVDVDFNGEGWRATVLPLLARQRALAHSAARVERELRVLDPSGAYSGLSAAELDARRRDARPTAAPPSFVPRSVESLAARADLKRKRKERPVRLVASNVYAGAMKAHGNATLQASAPCTTCRGEVRCGDPRVCINRACAMDCSSMCGLGCTNQRFRCSLMPALEVFSTGSTIIGDGLRCALPLAAGAFVAEMTGEVVSGDTLKARQRAHPNDTYAVALDPKNSLYLDARYFGNQARFINHSCEPNCAIFKWQSADGLPVVGIRVRDAAIEANTELTFDYQLDIAVGAAQRCLCGAPTCRGLVLDALDAAREESDLRDVDARLGAAAAKAAARRKVPEGWCVRI